MKTLLLCMLFNHVLLCAFWILYCVLHSVLATVTFKTYIAKRWRDPRYYRVTYVLFAFTGLIALIWYQVKMETEVWFQPPLFVLIAGGLVCLSGLLLMLVCIRKYFLQLSGLKSFFVGSGSSELMRGGLHRYIRHPLYLGTFAFIWGGFLLLPWFSILLSNIIITVYTLAGIRLEEKKLLGEYGEAYSAYRAEVGMLLPRFNGNARRNHRRKA